MVNIHPFCPWWIWGPSTGFPVEICLRSTWPLGRSGSVMLITLWMSRDRRWTKWRRVALSWGRQIRRGSWARALGRRTPCNWDKGRTSGPFPEDKESAWKCLPKCSEGGSEHRPLDANAADGKMRRRWPLSPLSSKCVPGAVKCKEIDIRNLESVANFS